MRRARGAHLGLVPDAEPRSPGRGAEAGEVVGYVRDACRYWGHTINRAYGEPFAVQETLGLTSLDAVL
jgi:hypothetical protein